MKYVFFLFIFFLGFFSELSADHIDPSAKSYQLREKSKFRTDVFDFSGAYPSLENIDIDARRKKRVEMFLTGDYPLLETVNYEGSFGSMISKFTGSFPKLTLVNFLCSSAAMEIDLRGDWKQSCEINIRGSTGNVTLTLPKDVGVIVNTKTATSGKVINNGLTKKGWGWINKTFVNSEFSKTPIQLTVNVEVTKAKITLK